MHFQKGILGRPFYCKNDPSWKFFMNNFNIATNQIDDY